MHQLRVPLHCDTCAFFIPKFKMCMLYCMRLFSHQSCDSMKVWSCPLKESSTALWLPPGFHLLFSWLVALG